MPVDKTRAKNVGYQNSDAGKHKGEEGDGTWLCLSSMDVNGASREKKVSEAKS